MAVAQEVRNPALASMPQRALLAGSVGNFIEWYEFGVYGFLATIMASNFFSAEGASDLESLTKTYASFALAFFFRPVGAALFGRIGDRIGRRPTLILVVLMMSGATALIGVLPTYATIGVAAPILLTLVRVLQGLSAGGEFGGAVSVMTEFAPRGRRGLYGSWQSFTVALGLLTAAGITATLATALSPEQLEAWGWRVPFLLALPMGLVALTGGTLMVLFWVLYFSAVIVFPDHEGVVGGYESAFVLADLFLTLLLVTAGWGLLTRRPWGVFCFVMASSIAMFLKASLVDSMIKRQVSILSVPFRGEIRVALKTIMLFFKQPLL